MKLIFIYGPPATGKLTVAEELVKKTNYRLFHNQLAVDLLSSVFEWGSPAFVEIKHLIWLKVFEKAAESSLEGMIFTFVYAKNHDDKLVNQIIKTVEERNGKVYLIRLYCDQNELMRRVKGESRTRYTKVKDRDRLKEMIAKWEMLSDVPGRKSLSIDNTHLSPEDVADKIIRYVGLNN